MKPSKLVPIIYEELVNQKTELENIVRSQKLIIKNLEMTIDTLEQYIEELGSKDASN